MSDVNLPQRSENTEGKEVGGVGGVVSSAAQVSRILIWEAAAQCDVHKAHDD